MRIVSIKYRKNHDHIIGSEWLKEFNLSIEYDKKEAQNVILNAIDESKEFLEGELEYPEDEQQLLNLNSGDYHLNVGDFSYYIEIE